MAQRFVALVTGRPTLARVADDSSSSDSDPDSDSDDALTLAALRDKVQSRATGCVHATEAARGLGLRSLGSRHRRQLCSSSSEDEATPQAPILATPTGKGARKARTPVPAEPPPPSSRLPVSVEPPPSARVVPVEPPPPARVPGAGTLPSQPQTARGEQTSKVMANPTAATAGPTPPRATHTGSLLAGTAVTAVAAAADPFSHVVSTTPRSKLPACLRALLDHNAKGHEELTPIRGLRTASVRAARVEREREEREESSEDEVIDTSFQRRV